VKVLAPLTLLLSALDEAKLEHWTLSVDERRAPEARLALVVRLALAGEASKASPSIVTTAEERSLAIRLLPTSPFVRE
jgi:hypothetical protein